MVHQRLGVDTVSHMLVNHADIERQNAVGKDRRADIAKISRYSATMLMVSEIV